MFLFPSGGQPWRGYDWGNGRRRSFWPAARAAGVDPRPYDIRHSFASLLIHEGRHSIMEIAAQPRPNPTTCLSTYAHVIAELQEAPRVPAEQRMPLLVPPTVMRPAGRLRGSSASTTLGSDAKPRPIRARMRPQYGPEAPTQRRPTTVSWP